MPPKRKLKGADLSETYAETQQRKELKVDSQKQATPILKSAGSATAPPMSAIAARRAKREAAAAEAGTAPFASESEVVPVPSPLNAPMQDAVDEDNEEQEALSVVTELDDQDELENLEEEEELLVEKTTQGKINKNSTGKARQDSAPKYSAKKPTKIWELDPRSISNFSPSNNNVVSVQINNETHLCIGFRKEESLVFAGQILLAPLFGAITVMGSTIYSGSPVPSSLSEETRELAFYPVFSPKTHSLLTIAAATEDAAHTQPSTLHGSLNINALTPMAKQLRDFSCIFVVKSLVGCGIEDIEDVLPLFKDIFSVNKTCTNNEDHLPDIGSIPGFQPILEPMHGVKAMQIPQTWSSNIDLLIDNENDLNVPSVSVVCGSKKMGKSTFSRYLANRLLNRHTRVAYLEADIGQCEFTPSGLVSLHILDQPILGPPFTHQHPKPRRCYFVGSTSPREDPSYYMDCVTELIKLWQFEYAHQEQAVPLVINTQGWIKGLGYDLLLNIIAAASPTDLFAFHSPATPSRNLPSTFANAVASPSPKAERTNLPVMRLLESAALSRGPFFVDKYNAADHRTLSLMSYFHQELDTIGTSNTTWWNFESRMVDRVPWTLDWRHGLNGVWVLYEDITTSQLLYSLNGAIVGLLGDVIDNQDVDGPRQQDISQDHNSTAPTNTLIPPIYYPSLQYPPPPPHSKTCHGLALIRAIDPARHMFLLLTPLPLRELKKVSGIVKGNLELPVWCMLDRRLGGGSGIAGVPWRLVPYTTLESMEGVGAGALKVRRNLMRRVQQSI